MRFKFTPIAGALALGLGILATGAQASSPILSVSNVVTDSSNLGLGATITTSGPTVSTYSSSSYNINYTTSLSTELTSEVIAPPTTSVAGLAYDYKTITTTKTWQDTTWKTDNLSIYVNSDGTNQSGGKWISLTGSVKSTIDTSLSFYLSASGSFTATATPFGPAAPLLASFYFGAAPPTSLSATTSTNIESSSYSSYTSSYSSPTFSLLSNVAQSFSAYVYAPTDVSVSDFHLSALTNGYDFVTTDEINISIGPKTLIGARVLAPIPEPESYAMLLAGLGVIGSIVRRRKHAR